MKDGERLVTLVLSLLLGTTLLVACATASRPEETGGSEGPAATSTEAAEVGQVGPSTAATPRRANVGPGPVSATRTAAPSPTPSQTQVPLIVVTGQVMDVSASARVILFAQPVHGIPAAALTEYTQIMSAEGSHGVLLDIKPGMVVQVVGRPGNSDAVLADQVRILTAPTPLGTATP
mgnify:CR=1 FL=1